MINPIAQTGDSDCSPVAIANAICWAQNWRFNEKHQAVLVRKACSLCKTDDEGTDDEDFLRALRSLGKEYGFRLGRKRYFKPKQTVEEIIKHIESGGSVIIAHLDIIDSALDWHHSFWFRVSGTGCLMGANVLGSVEFYACPPAGLEGILKITEDLGGGPPNRPEVLFLHKVSKSLSVKNTNKRK